MLPFIISAYYMVYMWVAIVYCTSVLIHSPTYSMYCYKLHYSLSAVVKQQPAERNVSILFHIIDPQLFLDMQLLQEVYKVYIYKPYHHCAHNIHPQTSEHILHIFSEENAPTHIERCATKSRSACSAATGRPSCLC